MKFIFLFLLFVAQIDADCTVSQNVQVTQSITVSGTLASTGLVTGTAGFSSSGDYSTSLCTTSLCSLQSTVFSINALIINNTYCTVVTCNSLGTALFVLQRPTTFDAFVMNPAIYNFSTQTTIVYDAGLVNPTLRYDPATGIFTAPVVEAGFYIFSWRLTVKNANSSMGADTSFSVSCTLVYNGANIESPVIFSGYPITGTLTLSGTAIIMVNSNSQVKVQCSGQTDQHAYPLNTVTVSGGSFSGFKMSS